MKILIVVLALFSIASALILYCCVKVGADAEKEYMNKEKR